ncbi:hypothetical protein Pmani_000406 [Petrolisthes manimaculis]|uniref:Uncharacterized protein n=1 Tax=Petrolisthes manimaculis TaxID=1843537 RepID=A0AAE1USS6_9EUCA|nr:hypothetical protein Pmani_000406 [Petrolisthes manimaculis]
MKGGECWVELSTNNDDEEEKNQKLMEYKCPYDLPEFPQLQLTVKCPDNVEQCATINFCNTESEATTVKTPTHCDVMNIPHQDGYREPLHHNHQYHNNNNTMMMMMKEVVLEAEIVLTPPPSTEVNIVRLEVGTLNNTPVGWIDFTRRPSDGEEALRFYCLQEDNVGRVLTPWNITPSHNTISIILKITKWWIKVYQEQEGNQQSLGADQQCPRGVGGFPHNELNVWCSDGDYCGQVSSPPTITEYTNVSTTWRGMDIDVMEGEEQVYNDTPSTTSPPRYYLVQVGIDWMRVIETTPGHNQTIEQYNCSRPLSHHLNFTISINCRFRKECGTVSQPCPTDLNFDDNSTEAMEMCLVVWGPIMLSVPKNVITLDDQSNGSDSDD